MPDPDPSRKTALWSLLVIAVLVVGGIWLERHMRAESLMEDCLLAGRKNCVAVSP